MRIGVFLCHCGTNIGGVVDIPFVASSVANLPYVKFVTEYKYLCSEQGQKLIRDSILEHKLTQVVIGSCSPRMHEKTFQKAISEAGLNPYMLYVVNLREHVSWVHKDKELATKKAKELMEAGIRRVVYNQALFTRNVPVIKKALVIGGGIAGIQAALDIADSGFEVILVEKEPSIGGRMAQLDKVFPTLDCSACILSPKMVSVAAHPNIILKTYAEVEKVSGTVGNFKVLVRNKARFVNSSCTGCGNCYEKCPSKVDNEFNQKLNKRKAIYMPFPQAVPAKAVIDKKHCLYFKTGKCRLCEKVCDIKAIDFTMEDELEELNVGVIVIATGYDLFEYSVYGEYGGNKYKNVITALDLERLFSSSGPTDAKVLIPGTDKAPSNIVFVQCVGSRDDQKGKSYCSKVCCMYTAKQAMLIKEKIPSAKIDIFYMDLRTAGKTYEEFLKRTQALPGVNYIRGRVSKLYELPNNKVKVKGTDTLLSENVEIDADLVVLASGIVARENSNKFAQLFQIPVDKDGFYNEAHPKLRPVETHTAGIFLAGACQGPRDIPETVAFASAAAAKAIGIILKDHLESQPMTAVVEPKDCSSCFACISVCPFKAIEQTITPNGKKVAVVKDELCEGCGACVATCRSGALNLNGFNNNMLFTEISNLCQK